MPVQEGCLPSLLLSFFETEWADYVTGKLDLMEHIAQNPDFWHWQGAPDQLLKLWFELEDVQSEELVVLIRRLRSYGYRCYVATEKEKYRTQYVRDVMFSGEFDGIFSTAEIGYRKTDIRFYESILASLEIEAQDVYFFDDSQSKVAAAARLGLDARLYTGVTAVEQSLE